MFCLPRQVKLSAAEQAPYVYEIEMTFNYRTVAGRQWQMALQASLRVNHPSTKSMQGKSPDAIWTFMISEHARARTRTLTLPIHFRGAWLTGYGSKFN